MKKITVDRYGNKQYLLNNLLHREDGPAIECKQGYKAWYLYGEFHREGNLPAVINSNGSKWYYVHGKLHREDGPAVEYSDGDKYYFLNGKELSERNFLNEAKRRKSLNYILSNIKKDLNESK